MPTRLITPPVAYPLHLDQIRQHLREDLTENDGLIEIYLAKAIEKAFAITQRQLVAARYMAIFDDLPCQVKLDVAPLIQVVGVQYLDGDSQWQSVPATDYVVEASFSPRITHGLGAAWPAPQGQIGSVRVTFDAGYVALMTADSVADTIRLQGWKDLAAGDVLRLSNSGGALPKPLKEMTDYYVQAVVSPGVYKLALTDGGAAIALTDNGAGYSYAGQTGINDGEGVIPGGLLAWLLLEVETVYSFRGNLINTPASTINKNPFADNLLDPYRMSYL
jgi:uncharacterized phiE125 gp8 family phage protein